MGGTCQYRTGRDQEPTLVLPMAIIVRDSAKLSTVLVHRRRQKNYERQWRHMQAIILRTFRPGIGCSLTFLCLTPLRVLVANSNSIKQCYYNWLLKTCLVCCFCWEIASTSLLLGFWVTCNNKIWQFVFVFLELADKGRNSMRSNIRQVRPLR